MGNQPGAQHKVFSVHNKSQLNLYGCTYYISPARTSCLQDLHHVLRCFPHPPPQETSFIFQSVCTSWRTKLLHFPRTSRMQPQEPSRAHAKRSTDKASSHTLQLLRSIPASLEAATIVTIPSFFPKHSGIDVTSALQSCVTRVLRVDVGRVQARVRTHVFDSPTPVFVVPLADESEQFSGLPVKSSCSNSRPRRASPTFQQRIRQRNRFLAS